MTCYGANLQGLPLLPPLLLSLQARTFDLHEFGSQAITLTERMVALISHAAATCATQQAPIEHRTALAVLRLKWAVRWTCTR